MEATSPRRPEWKRTEESKQLIIFKPMQWWRCLLGCVCVCRKRDAYLQKGKALLKEGKKSEAVDCFQKCVDVSPEMALAFIKVSVYKVSLLTHKD